MVGDFVDAVFVDSLPNAGQVEMHLRKVLVEMYVMVLFLYLGWGHCAQRQEDVQTGVMENLSGLVVVFPHLFPQLYGDTHREELNNQPAGQKIHSSG